MPEKKKKNRVLKIEVLVDDETKYNRTAEHRETFFRGYIDSMPGCKVLNTEIEDAEVINIDNNGTDNSDK